MKTCRLVIGGRVQGVGYRDWMVNEALRLGVSGWVRNLGGAQVEAVVQGDDAALDALIAACRRGPHYARVDDVTIHQAQAVEDRAFVRLPSA